MQRLTWLGMLFVLFATLAAPALAGAHGGGGGAQTTVQTIGGHEIALTIRQPARVPGPLPIELMVRGAAAPQVTLAAVPAGERIGVAGARVRPLAGLQGPYYAQLQVDRAGGWELALRVGDAPVTRIPSMWRCGVARWSSG